MSRYRINPGELRHIVTFQKPTNAENAYGEVRDDCDWVDALVDVRVGIYPISGKEFYTASSVNSEVTHKIKMRYVPNITSDMRIKFGERIFELISPPINFQEKNVEIQLLCKEVF
jgi:SPP1 family predicted phage head-tail adaptor